MKPRRADDATRITLVVLSRFVDLRQLLLIVKPDTLIRWHRMAFRLFWRWKSQRLGRPPIPANLRELIAQMATANRTWGEERIADELLSKLGIRISPRTVAARQIGIYSVDYPATQTWKRQLPADAQIGLPPWLVFVPVDFELDDVGDKLVASGFQENSPAFFTWLGVVPYLTEDTIGRTPDASRSLVRQTNNAHRQ